MNRCRQWLLGLVACQWVISFVLYSAYLGLLGAPLGDYLYYWKAPGMVAVLGLMAMGVQGHYRRRKGIRLSSHRFFALDGYLLGGLCLAVLVATWYNLRQVGLLP